VRPRRLAAVASLLGVAVSASQQVAAAPTEPGTLINPLVTTEACENCHLFGNPAPMAMDPPFSPFRTWQGTMMANAARDPVFWAGVAVADADAPGQTSLCVRCHAPRAFLDGDGDITSIDQLSNDQLAGVECELCHRSMEDLEAEVGNARYTIDDVVVDTNVPRRGPWDFTDGNDPPPHSWIHDPFIGTSRLCGNCHDVSTPAERVDDAGVGMGVPFNEQRTYSEWLGSAYAAPGDGFRSCQDCHMPAVDDMAACTAHQNLQSHPTGGRRHDLVGANRFMVSMIKQEYGSAGANVLSDQFFDTTLDRYDEFLATAATLELTAPREVDLTQGLAGIDVRVTNNSGHKLPSGYAEGRVMWLEVVAQYAGEVVYSSGAWDQVRGMQQDAQLHTYEALAEDYADGTQLHLLRNNHWIVDSRIPPLGLVANLETDPIGDRYTLQGDGTWPNFDDVGYAFPAAPQIADATPGDPDPDVLTLTVRLRYLINTPEYIEFLGDNGADAGQHVAQLFDLAGGATPETLAEQTVAIAITAFGTAAGSSSSSGDASSGDGSGATTAADTSGTATSDASTSTSAGSAGSSSGAGSSSSSEGGGGSGGGGGCGCNSAPGGAPAGAFGLFALAVARRRRRR
jgi:MYXO-CTERM domain-containing protein